MIATNLTKCGAVLAIGLAIAAVACSSESSPGPDEKTNTDEQEMKWTPVNCKKMACVHAGQCCTCCGDVIDCRHPDPRACM
jgi:hypothetical protein